MVDKMLADVLRKTRRNCARRGLLLRPDVIPQSLARIVDGRRVSLTPFKGLARSTWRTWPAGSRAAARTPRPGLRAARTRLLEGSRVRPWRGRSCATSRGRAPGPSSSRTCGCRGGEQIEAGYGYFVPDFEGALCRDGGLRGAGGGDDSVGRRRRLDVASIATGVYWKPLGLIDGGAGVVAAHVDASFPLTPHNVPAGQRRSQVKGIELGTRFWGCSSESETWTAAITRSSRRFVTVILEGFNCHNSSDACGGNARRGARPRPSLSDDSASRASATSGSTVAGASCGRVLQRPRTSSLLFHELSPASTPLGWCRTRLSLGVVAVRAIIRTTKLASVDISRGWCCRGPMLPASDSNSRAPRAA